MYIEIYQPSVRREKIMFPESSNYELRSVPNLETEYSSPEFEYTTDNSVTYSGTTPKLFKVLLKYDAVLSSAPDEVPDSIKLFSNVVINGVPSPKVGSEILIARSKSFFPGMVSLLLLINPGDKLKPVWAVAPHSGDYEVSFSDINFQIIEV